MFKVKFNSFMNFEIERNKVTMKLDEGWNGYEFQTVVHNLKDNQVIHTINYIRDKRKNRTYKSEKFTKRYSAWVASILFDLQKEGYLKLQ
jgi:hypothetical protein